MCLCVFGCMCVQITVVPDEGFRSSVAGVTGVGELLDMNSGN